MEMNEECVETGKIFKSAADASRYLGLKHDNTLATYINLNIKCCGYHWEYING